MIAYQPSFRPLVRAYMAQTPPPAPPPAPGAAPAQPPTVKVPLDIAGQTADVVAIARKTRIVALSASGLGILGGGVAAYCSYKRSKGKVDTAVLVAGAFAFVNLLFFGMTIAD